ncbi:porin family protein [Pseudopedobacter saltans]|nr:porin family protein [Pseudopedobacter saltans]
MKKIFAISLLMILAFTIKAQVKYGLKAGVNFATATFKNYDLSISPSNLTTFHIAGFVDIPIDGMFSFQPGVTYLGKGYKYDLPNGDSKGEVDLSYIEIPMNGIAYFPTRSGRIFVGAGPYLGFGISGNIDEITSERDLKFGNGVNDDVNPMDIGLNFMLGYHLNGGLLFNAGYGLGLSNTIPKDKRTDDAKIHHKQFFLSLGYSF